MTLLFAKTVFQLDNHFKNSCIFTYYKEYCMAILRYKFYLKFDSAKKYYN